MAGLWSWWVADANGWKHAFWMLCALALFLPSVEKRPRALPWMVALSLCCLALGRLIPPTFTMNDALGSLLWFGTAYLLICAVCYAVCAVSVKEALMLGTYALFTEHMASCAYILVWAGTDKLFAPGPYKAITYAVVYLAVWLIFGRRMAPRSGHLQLSWLNTIVTAVSGVAVTIVFSMMVKRNIDLLTTYYITDPHQVAVLRICQLYGASFCAVMLAAQYIQQKELSYHRQLAKSHELWKLRQEQYKLSRENIELINHKCHDMKHQLAALMAQDGNGARKARLAQEIDGMVQIYDMSVDTKNEALNTILMEKGLYCSMHGIHWTCAADGSQLDFIDFMDLYTLLGNALDNAIEAVEKITDPEKRIIQLQLAPRDGFVHLRVENSTAAPLKWKGDLPLTSKADKSSHGFGLRSIRALAEKYQGFASFSEEAGSFTLSILIPLPQAGKQ